MIICVILYQNAITRLQFQIHIYAFIQKASNAYVRYEATSGTFVLSYRREKLFLSAFAQNICNIIKTSV